MRPDKAAHIGVVYSPLLSLSPAAELLTFLGTVHKIGALKMNKEKGYKQHQHELLRAQTTAGAAYKSMNLLVKSSNLAME